MTRRSRIAGRARDWLVLVSSCVCATFAVLILGGVALGGVLQAALQVGMQNHAIPVGIGFAVLALGLGVAYVLLPPGSSGAPR